MKKVTLQLGILLTFICLAFSSITFANEHAKSGHNKKESHGSEGPINTPDEITGYIKHHLQDAHDFVLYTDGSTGKHIGFSLPVILLDNGLHVFSAANFHHGEAVVESNGKHYKLFHGKIYGTDKNGTIHMHGEHPSNYKPLDLSITKSALGILIAGLLMILFFGSLARSYKKGPIPTGLGRVLEPLVLYVRDEIARPNIGEKKIQKIHAVLINSVFLYLDFEFIRFNSTRV